MQKKQSDKIIEVIEKTIVKTIRLEVNGKIDKLRKDIKEHKEELKPVMEAFNSASIMGRFIIWISKVLLALGIITASIMAFIKLLK